MGNKQSVFTDKELEDYQELTFFTKNEILHVFDRFKKLDLLNAGTKDTKYWKTVRLSKEDIMSMPELKMNPFKYRICEVFSSNCDGRLSFEDFLDMMSVFSETATKEVKVEYAFRIYDFDNDNKISKGDLEQIIGLLTGEPMLDQIQMKLLIKNILNEGDLDNDGVLSFAEFQHVLSKTPDFVNSFRIRL